jgi:surface protein
MAHIYAWRDNTTLYYYTAAEKIYLNEDSSHMFQEFAGLTGLNLNDWDASNVTDMNYMFFSCTSLNELNVDNWDVSNVENME